MGNSLRPRWASWVGAGLVVAIGVVWLVYSDVTLPDERYVAAPDPCTLLSTETVSSLVGDATGFRDDPPQPSALGPPLSRPEERLRCRWDVPYRSERWGSISVSVEVFHGRKFGLGSSGEERAESSFAFSYDVCRSEALGPVVYRVDDGDPTCANGSWLPFQFVLELNLLRANVVASVDVRTYVPWPPPEEPPWDAAEEAERLADEILSRLDAA